MKLKAKALKIDSQSPYGDDCLGRREQAETLTKIVEDIREPFVLAVDAPFGMGKSTFVQMWKASLQGQDFTTLYFNAWENDFTDNALTSLLGEFRRELETEVGNKEVTAVWKKAKKAGAVIARSAGPAVIKVLTAGALDMEKLGEAIGEATEKAAEKGIENYDQDKNTIQAFKDELATFIQKKSPGKPVVFFIDELDRCRPLFAIEVLEHAKHLFSVDGLIFVLSMDKEQLAHSLRAVYGMGMNVDGYLARFIDLTYHLPEPDLILFTQNITTRIGAFSGMKNQSQAVLSLKSVELIQNTMVILATHFEFSLREVEHLFTQVILVWKLTPMEFNVGVIATLVCLKKHDPGRYFEFVAATRDLNEHIPEINKTALKFKQGNLRYAAFQVLALIRVFSMPSKEADGLLSSLRSREGRSDRPEGYEEVLVKYWFNFRLDDLNREKLLKCIDLCQPFANSKP